MRMANYKVWAEMARRKLKFHPDEDWRTIQLWGLFSWGAISHLLKKGDLLAPGYKKINRTVWAFPSEEAYHKHIEPLLKSYTLEELTKMAGWE